MLVNEHKSRKQDAYWLNLVEGETGQYKAAEMDRLLKEHIQGSVRNILDVGCGTSVIARMYHDYFKAEKLVFMDYDEAVITRMRASDTDPCVEYRVGDIFKLDTGSGSFDLVFLLDMLHEVYSFCGRRDKATDGEIDHSRGIAAVAAALARIASVVTPGGGIVITDNVLCEEDRLVTVEITSSEALEAVQRFFEEYPSRRMDPEWLAGNIMRLPAHHLCALLTQYNKIKKGLEARWAVEQLEVHQYMRESDFQRLFDALGFDCYITIGTPKDTRQEWEGDFKVLHGLSALPEKRITCLAVRREQVQEMRAA